MYHLGMYADVSFVLLCVALVLLLAVGALPLCLELNHALESWTSQSCAKRHSARCASTQWPAAAIVVVYL